jgi:hypothetical protein
VSMICSRSNRPSIAMARTHDCGSNSSKELMAQKSFLLKICNRCL